MGSYAIWVPCYIKEGEAFRKETMRDMGILVIVFVKVASDVEES